MTHRNLNVLARFALAASLFLLSCVASSLQGQQAQVPSQVDVQAMHLMQVDGKPVSPAMLRGKAIVLNFWAPWCPPCKLEIPWLQQLQQINKADALVIGVVADPSKYAQAKQYMAAHGVTYLIVQDSASVVKIFGDMEGLPTSFYITADGRTVHSVMGLISQTTMAKYLQDAVHTSTKHAALDARTTRNGTNSTRPVLAAKLNETAEQDTAALPHSGTAITR